MRTRLLSLLVLTFIVVGINAQTINITQGDSKTFQLNNPSGNLTSAEWRLDGSLVQTGLTYTNTWNTVQDYTLMVTPISDKTCRGDNKSVTVHVVADVTTLPVQISITSAAEVCPVTTGNPTGGQSATVVSLTNYTLGGAESWSLKYKIDNGSEVSVALTNGATGFTIDASAVAAGAHTLRIMSFTVNGNTTMYNDTNAPSIALTVNAAPTIDGVF